MRTWCHFRIPRMPTRMTPRNHHEIQILMPQSHSSKRYLCAHARSSGRCAQIVARGSLRLWKKVNYHFSRRSKLPPSGLPFVIVGNIVLNVLLAMLASWRSCSRERPQSSSNLVLSMGVTSNRVRGSIKFSYYGQLAHQDSQKPWVSSLSACASLASVVAFCLDPNLW